MATAGGRGGGRRAGGGGAKKVGWKGGGVEGGGSAHDFAVSDSWIFCISWKGSDRWKEVQFV